MRSVFLEPLRSGDEEAFTPKRGASHKSRPLARNGWLFFRDFALEQHSRHVAVAWCAQQLPETDFRRATQTGEGKAGGGRN